MFRTSLCLVAFVAAPLAAQSATAPTSVSRAEVTANAEAEFARVDANKDGHMTRVEIETFQRTSGTARATARNKALFGELDSDKNGMISPAEFATLVKAPTVDASAVLRVDANKDGKVSLAEHRSAALDTFAKIDTNKDGTLTAGEVKALIQTR